MNINKSMLSDLQIALHKSNKNLKSRSKIIVLRIFQLMKARSNAFAHSINPQMSFLSAEVILLLNLFVKVIIILNSF